MLQGKLSFPCRFQLVSNRWMGYLSLSSSTAGVSTSIDVSVSSTSMGSSSCIGSFLIGHSSICRSTVDISLSKTCRSWTDIPISRRLCNPSHEWECWFWWSCRIWPVVLTISDSSPSALLRHPTVVTVPVPDVEFIDGVGTVVVSIDSIGPSFYAGCGDSVSDSGTLSSHTSRSIDLSFWV